MHSFVFSGCGFANAVRRALIADVEAWAPCTVEFETNTSCANDEFLAHRIGQIPFVKFGPGTSTAILEAVGPCVVTAAHISGDDFRPVHPEIELIPLRDAQQRLKLKVSFDMQKGSTHARYAICSGVGMRRLDDGDDEWEIQFSTNDGADPTCIMARALDALEEKVDRALAALDAQPVTPPRSCAS